MSEMYQGNERRMEFRCTCNEPLNFCYREHDPVDKVDKFKCSRCGKLTPIRRWADTEKFVKLKKIFNGK